MEHAYLRDDEAMGHTLAYLRDDVEREARRGDFLHAALRNYAPHALNDIERELEEKYPRARSLRVRMEAA